MQSAVKSRLYFKFGVVEEETDETQYWLELLLAANIGEANLIEGLLAEASELIAIFTATGRTAKLWNKRPSAIRDSKSDIRDSK
jgi:hypothetical protein